MKFSEFVITVSFTVLIILLLLDLEAKYDKLCFKFPGETEWKCAVLVSRPTP